MSSKASLDTSLIFLFHHLKSSLALLLRRWIVQPFFHSDIYWTYSIQKRCFEDPQAYHLKFISSPLLYSFHWWLGVLEPFWWAFKHTQDMLLKRHPRRNLMEACIAHHNEGSNPPTQEICLMPLDKWLTEKALQTLVHYTEEHLQLSKPVSYDQEFTALSPVHISFRNLIGVYRYPGKKNWSVDIQRNLQWSLNKS